MAAEVIDAENYSEFFKAFLVLLFLRPALLKIFWTWESVQDSKDDFETKLIHGEP